MPNPIRPGNIGFDLSFKKARASERLDEDAPLRIVILGSFSARTDGETTSSRAVRVDCDNFDSACAQFGAALRLPPGIAGALEVELVLKNLDDFHPDQLLKNIPPLASLSQLRARLLNPRDADAAAAELRGILDVGAAAPAAEPAASQPVESTEDTLARLLGKPPAKSPVPVAPASVVERLLKEAVSSTAVPAAPPEQAQLLSMLDADLTSRLRQILLYPEFKALEAAWRGLDFLVRESGDNVELYVIDISRDELDRQLASTENPAATPAARQIEQIAPAVILSAFFFDASDAAVLHRIARLAAGCGTAFIGGAEPDLIGCTSFASQPNPLDWTNTAGPELNAFAELRRAPGSAHIGLAMPRFLLRLPFGKDSDPIQSFPFEELPGDNAHERYLWGNSALLCGHLLVNSFVDDGWEMDLDGTGGEIGGLPVHSYKADGEKQTEPCAEAWLSDKAGDVILNRGLIPVLSVRGRDSVLLVSLRSISDPPSPLRFRLG